MQITVTLDWDNATDDQKKGWLVFVPLPDEFIDKIFKDLDTEQLQLCITCQTWSTDLISKYWNSCTKTEQVYLLTHQKLSPEFIDTIWADGDATIRAWIIDTQQLSLKQTFGKWAELTTKQKATTFGLPWEDNWARVSVGGGGKVNEFLTVMDRLWEEVGTDAESCLNALPELLTHPNELVRAVAAGYMDGHMNHIKATNSRVSISRN